MSQESMPDDVAALLAAERDDGEAMPERARARVGRKIAATIASGAASGLGGAGVGEAAGQGAVAGSLGSTGSTPALGGGALFGAKTFVAVALAAATGGLLGAARSEWAPVRLTLDEASALAGARASAPPPRPTPAIAPPAAPPPAATAPTTRSAPTPRTRSDARSSLAAEQVLLDDAQHALAAGAAPRALAALDRHAARYPKGLLAEEREAMAIRALVAAGDRAAARRRAAAFTAAWPASLFRGAVDAALSSP